MTGPSAAPVVLNGYEASCPRPVLTTLATTALLSLLSTIFDLKLG
jgi:hypothetical protein